MEGKYDDVELLFIQEVLDQHGEFVCDLLRDDIQQKRLRVSDDLLDSIDYKVSKYGIDPVLLINFISYGRAIEIAWHQRSKNTKQWVTDTNKAVWGNASRQKKKKNTRWYSRNVYGSVNRLLSILSSEFSEEEKNRLKNILHQTQIRMAL
jgi:hypothetical protein